MSISESPNTNDDIKSESQKNIIIINPDNSNNDSFNKLFTIQNLILKQAGLKELCKFFFKLY